MTENEDKNGGVQPDERADAIRAEAVGWFEFINHGGGTPAEAEAFRTWLHADPAHAEALRKLEQAWRDLPLIEDVEHWAQPSEPPAEDRAGNTRRPAARHSLARNPVLWGAIAACFALVTVPSAMFLSRRPDWSAPAPVVYATGTAETQTVTLDDASTVYLNAESEIDVIYSAHSRYVVLKRGVAYFDVASNPDRPFTVVSAHTRIAVVGTAFEVWRSSDSVRVSVARGRVEVAPDRPLASAVASSTFLTPGDQVSASLAGTLGEVAPFNPDETLAWRRGRFIYSSVPLRTLIADINRYRKAKVVLSDPSLGDMQVTAAFSEPDIDNFLQGFAEAEGLYLDDSGDRIALSQR